MRRSSSQDALFDLVRVAHEISETWSVASPLPDLEKLHLAYRALTVATAGQSPLASQEGRLVPSGPARFEAALWILDPGVYDPSALAQAMAKACAEVARERGDANLDPATRLIAFQLARAVDAPPTLKETDELVVACTLRMLGR